MAGEGETQRAVRGQCAVLGALGDLLGDRDDQQCAHRAVGVAQRDPSAVRQAGSGLSCSTTRHRTGEPSDKFADTLVQPRGTFAEFQRLGAVPRSPTPVPLPSAPASSRRCLRSVASSSSRRFRTSAGRSGSLSAVISTSRSGASPARPSTVIDPVAKFGHHVDDTVHAAPQVLGQLRRTATVNCSSQRLGGQRGNLLSHPVILFSSGTGTRRYGSRLLAPDIIGRGR